MYKYTNTTKTRKFFKKAVTNTRRITLTKQKLLLGAKNWRYIIYVEKRFLSIVISAVMILSLACSTLAVGSLVGILETAPSTVQSTRPTIRLMLKRELA